MVSGVGLGLAPEYLGVMAGLNFCSNFLLTRTPGSSSDDLTDRFLLPTDEILLEFLAPGFSTTDFWGVNQEVGTFFLCLSLSNTK